MMCKLQPLNLKDYDDPLEWLLRYDNTPTTLPDWPTSDDFRVVLAVGDLEGDTITHVLAVNAPATLRDVIMAAGSPKLFFTLPANVVDGVIKSN